MGIIAHSKSGTHNHKRPQWGAPIRIIDSTGQDCIEASLVHRGRHRHNLPVQIRRFGFILSQCFHLGLVAVVDISPSNVKPVMTYLLKKRR